MLEELEDEKTSINAIYGETTLQAISTSPTILFLTLPQQPEISLRLEFPQDYPDTPPSVLGTQSVGSNAAKGAGSQIVELLRNVLAEVYVPGAPCLYDLMEATGARLQQLGLDQSNTENANSQEAPQANGQATTTTQQNPTSDSPQDPDTQGEEPPWTLSNVVSEKKSVFIARAAPVASPAQARTYLSHLLATDKKVAKATHNITAWRISSPDNSGVQYQDCDDDGESAAGGRVLHLLELMGVWGVMVVVSRWYGGVQLGPDRFRIINQTAREAVVRAGFGQAQEGAGAGAGGGGGKKGKGKK